MPGPRQYPSRPFLGVGALIFEGEKILLVERGKEPLKGYWSLPGGILETGETLRDGTRREVFEETGYELRRVKRLYSYHPTNGTSDKEFHILHGQAGRQTGSIDPHEVEALRWVTRQELRQMLKSHKIRDGLTLSALLFI